MIHPIVRAFIQARMSSVRFPGKVLAPLDGLPVIAHVIARIREIIPANQITVATSTQPSDDPLACYVRDLGVSVFRGHLGNVFVRFQQCLGRFPCDWFLRICADSPLLEGAMLRAMLTYCDRSDVDLVTNTYPRTFPKGRSLELLRSATFASLDPSRLSGAEREHLTKVYYNHPTEFRIINIKSADPSLIDPNLCVDTIEDLQRLEQLLQDGNCLAPRLTEKSA